MSPFMWLSAFVAAYMCYVEGQSSCRTPSSADGQCVSVYDCQELLVLLNKPNRTPQDVELLRKSQCGFQGNVPNVCCPNSKPTPAPGSSTCFTPDGAAGKCVSIYSCQHLADMLRQPIPTENLNFLQQSRCTGPDQYSVCCGPARSVPPAPTPGDGSCPQTGALPGRNSGCCGVQSGGGNRIVGGSATSVDQYPWMALIEYVQRAQIRLLCGAALVSGRYVLTAGHCVLGAVLELGKPTNVRLGEYDTSHDGPDCVLVEGGSEDCTEGTHIIPIESVIPHPEYRPNHQLRRNDIALLRLQRNAPYTDFIRPICLPALDRTINPPAKFQMVAAGWGAINSTVSKSNIKLDVDLPFRTKQDCQPSYSVPRRNVALWDGQLCAGGEKDKDSCKGDSGGPLMYEDQGTFEIIGVVSFGPTPCGLENIPGVYTNVFHYVPWIRSQVKP